VADSTKHHLTPMARIRSMIQVEREDLWVVLVYSIAIGLLSLVVPVAVQSVVNTVQFGTLMQPLIVLAGFVFVALGFQSILQALRTVVIETMQQRIFVRLAGDVAHRLERVRVQAFDKEHGPELVNRFLDVVTVQKASSQLAIDGLELVMQTILGMIVLAVYHPILLGFDIVLLILILAVLWLFGSGAAATSLAESKVKYELVAWLQEMARHVVTTKSGWGARFFLDKTDRLVCSYISYRSKHFKVLLRQIIGFLTLQALASSILLGVGGYLVILNQLTLGQLIAAELIVSLIVTALAKFGKQLETFYDLQAAVDKLGYLTDLPEERVDGESLPWIPKGAQIEMANGFLTLPGRPELIKDLSFSVSPGARVGLFGSAGQGKSMLLDLLYGTRTLDRGIVTIDGRHYRDLELRSLRTQVALIRDNEAFRGTITDNVRLGNTDATMDDVRQALESVHLLRDVMQLPDGMETQIKTGGLPLTPSQTIRLMIARAICARPRLLILDETLDSLDEAEQVELLNVLFSPQMKWTVITASASLTVLSRCEFVYTLQGGRLIESHQLAGYRGGNQ
jgi:putative ABC transport system ATP-binding protein